MCMMWLISPIIHAAYSEEENVFYLDNKDRHVEFTSDGTITFKTDANLSYTYRDGGVVFMPKNPGEVIVATVESLELPDKAVLFVWNNNIEAIKDKVGVSGASTTEYKYMPEGWIAEHKNGSAPGTYQSADPTGGLIIALHTSSWEKGTNGFSIRISSGVPKAMEFGSVSYTATERLNRGLKNACIGVFNATTEGLTDPLKLTRLKANVSALEQQGISNLRLSAKTDGSQILASATNGVIDWTSETELASGRNPYYLVGDLPTDFSGVLADVTAMSAIVAGVNHDISAIGSAVVENSILMPVGPAVYTISDAAGFYDDGGKNGKIGDKFNGSVTFVPADPTNKIKVDFDKLAIFYNPSAVSVGNQDVFKFYNGREANEANLITLLTDKAKIVKSTADDGSMTVTLASKTGVPADGWEAVVSQYLPGNMTFASATSSKTETTTASAYDAEVPVAIVNVRTDNNSNPLKVSSLKLTLTNPSDVAAISVYSLGEEQEFSTANKIASIADVNSETVTIAFDGEGIELSEGQNNFAVSVDVAKTASNGDVITVKPSEVTVGREDKTLENAETAEITVANVFSHHVGADVREIHDVWAFNSTPDPISTTKYLLKNEDCTVTFIPNEGAISILEFSDFDVYYANGSYGTKAKFEVYSGRTADASNLLWKLEANGAKPDGKLKSAAEDGSITVVFNANTTSSYYAGKGWKGTVTPFTNHDMTIESVQVSQTNMSAIMPGGAAERILDLNITTEGTLDSRKLAAVTVNLKNSRAAVRRVSVQKIDSEGNAAEVGSVDVADADELTVNCDAVLAEGDNAFCVAYDIDADATPDAIIDAKIVKISTDKGDVTVENGDPNGERIVKYQYLMSDGNHEVTVSKTIHFYDDGGSDGALNKNGLNGSVTFIPADPTKKIRVTVVKYATAATGVLDFYSGRAVAETSLGQCKQSKFPALPMVSKADDGAMYVNVACKSYSYGTYDGWDMIVEQYTPSDLYVDSATTDNAATTQTVRGAKDALLAKVCVKYEGDTKTLGVSKLDAEATDDNMSDITEMKLWCTGTNDGFVPSNLLATAVPTADGKVTFEVNEPSQGDVLGNYYYWITASISAEATAGNKIGVTPRSLVATDGKTTEIREATVAETFVKNGFAGGEFVVGDSEAADYSTFAEAIAAMGDAIEGPVTIKVEPGTYAEDIKIANVTGTSQSNTITITSQSGNAEDVVLTGKGFTDTSYNAPKYGIVTVENTDWVILDALTFNGKISGGTEYPYYVYYVGHSRHNTLSNSVMMAPTATTYSGLNMVYNNFPDGVEASGYNPDYLTIKDNSFTGGYIAIYIQGSKGYVKFEHMKGLTVIGNKFTDVGSKCVYPYQVEDVFIDGNQMTAGEAVTKTNYFAIDAVRVRGNVNMCNNRVVNNQMVYSSGINLRDSSFGTAENPIRVYNNSIAITASPNASTAGIVVASDCRYIDLVHNSVNIEGASGHGISFTNRSQGLDGVRLANNAVRIAATGTGDSYVMNLVNTELISKLNFRNNAFFSTSKLSGVAADADAWKTLTGDETLVNEEPKYLTATDLHLGESGSLNAGSFIDYAKFDIDGNMRPQVPTIGAFEFSPIPMDKPLMTEGYPKVMIVEPYSAKVALKWNMSGKMYYMAVATDAEAPAESEMLQTDSVDVIGDTETVVTLTKLTDQTAYKVYMMLVGANTVNSDIVFADFITKRYIEPLLVDLDTDWGDIDAGDSVTIEPDVTGGDKPYTFVWKDRIGHTVGEEETLTVSPELSEVYTLSVTSADGQSVDAFTSVTVYGTTADAGFEDNTLAENSYWNGVKDDDLMTYHFYSGGFMFSNTCMPSYNFWGGFAYANRTANKFEQLMPDQFNNVVGGGHESDTYAVAYTGGANCTIDVLKSCEGAELDHVYLTNSAYTADNILNGDGFSSKFGDGDYYKVTFTGDDPEGQPVEYYLADFRDGKTDVVKTWNKVDLKPLGKKVKRITLKTEGSNVYVPSYVALDDLAYADLATAVNAVEADLSADDVKRIRVIAVDGAVRMIVENAGRFLSAEDLSGLNAGIYIIEYEFANGQLKTFKTIQR